VEPTIAEVVLPEAIDFVNPLGRLGGTTVAHADAAEWGEYGRAEIDGYRPVAGDSAGAEGLKWVKF
jgi:hypothetical protein